MHKVPVTQLGYLFWGVLMGGLSGLLGIGGGSLILPVVHLVYGRSMHLAIGTTLAAMVVGSLSGAVRHATYGNVDWPMAIAMGIGAILGASLLGAPLAEVLPSNVLSKLFGLFLCLIGLQMMGLFGWVGRLVGLC
ncbi:MAG: sulfite exporter TauE/SafE family protein [Armatimonadetes bacterium]|nr:sulfite exporter TauE/SafE family protein [Armatimonadota bacterium]